ncbi:hypothetical protein U27_04712 [Candidatus Vecturithrix granuli]|uniref:Uncharacterized protein n=1 Tax=Vecturithrix granuli TaxID=1499967 RepID=A0A081BZJ0_VECG1|nr:hypothetical protein U27_04712 [Candidatus Vecturithrix granuli]
MILPIGLFTLFVFGSIRLAVNLIWPERRVKRKYHKIYTVGVHKYHFIDAVSSCIAVFLLFLSLQYMYFPYVWGSIAIVMLIDAFFHLWASTGGKHLFKNYESAQMPDEWRQKELANLRRGMPIGIVAIGLRAFSWSKTFPVVPLQLSPSVELGVSLVIGLTVIGGIILYTIKNSPPSHTRNIPHPDSTNSVSGTLHDISKFIHGLMVSQNPEAFTIIRVQDIDTVVQFTGDSRGVQMDFPMATESQQRLRSRIEEGCGNLGLSLSVNRGTDGTEFLDYDLHGEPDSIGEIIQQVLVQVFRVDESSQLTFDVYGY